LLAFRYRPAYHQGRACCDARHELEHGLSAALGQRQDALSRRLPPTLKRTSTHALVISDSYFKVPLEASPESLPVHASLPAVTGPPLFQTKGVVFPYVWSVEPCHGHPCRLSPLPLSLSREKHIEPDQDRIGHTLRERCVAHSAQGAFACRDPPKGSPPGLDFAVDSRVLMPFCYPGSMSQDR